MHAVSQKILIDPLQPPPAMPMPALPGVLAQAFSEFIAASDRLEQSYRELQGEVAELSAALTERNQALHQSLSVNRSMGILLERMVSAMPCGVLIAAAGGECRLVNAEAERMLELGTRHGQTLDAISARTGLDLSSQETGEGPEGLEQELAFRCEGAERWAAVRRVALPLPEGDGESGAETVVILRDITRRKQMEREREAARDTVALAQVSALLAHEIRNSLASLELFAGLIADLPERRDEWLAHLRAGIRSLSGTVNNVLTFHGGAMPVTEHMEVARELQQAVEFLQPLAQQAGVVLELEPVAADMTLLANRSALQQMLLNLCANALRHTGPGGTVRMRCESAGKEGGVRIAVTDTGCGIAPEHLARLFEGGFSVSGTTPGLGLAVCDRLMRQHGGCIGVESQLQRGSTFTLEFPRR